MEPDIKLYGDDHVEVNRRSRYVVAELLCPHLVISTSRVNGGVRDNLTHLVNHQSCEAAGHQSRFETIMALGQTGYHHKVCEELELDGERTATMGTAANMQYTALGEASYEEFKVTALVTAGVGGNAGRAGDRSHYVERAGSYEKVPKSGTINTLLFFNTSLSESALARAVVTMTEAKSAVLQELAVWSRVSSGLATGTGTDQFCIATPLLGGDPQVTWTGKHAKMGELIGLAVQDATREALRWQNGLEASLTRSLFHALERYGVTEDYFNDYIEQNLEEDERTFVKKNHKSVIYEPQVAGCAYAIAAILDRLEYGTLPDAAADELLLNQCALLSSVLAARPSLYAELRNELAEGLGMPLPELVMKAVLLGWKRKWA